MWLIASTLVVQLHDEDGVMACGLDVVARRGGWQECRAHAHAVGYEADVTNVVGLWC